MIGNHKVWSQDTSWTDRLNLSSMVQPVPMANKLIDQGCCVWSGSVTKGGDGKFSCFIRAGLYPMVSDHGQVFGKNAYATEGWCVSTRGWEATVTFATLGSLQIRFFDTDYKNEITQAKAGQTITVELKAALNQDWNKADKGWVDIRNGKSPAQKLEVNETGPNTGLFTAKYQLPKGENGAKIEASYGYMGFEKRAIISCNNY